MASTSQRYCRHSRTYRLSDDGLQKIHELAEFYGVSDTAIIELSVREKYHRDLPRLQREAENGQDSGNVR